MTEDDALSNVLPFERPPPRNVDGSGGDIGCYDLEAVARDLRERVLRLRAERDAGPVTGPDLAHFQSLVEELQAQLRAQMQCIIALQDHIEILERHTLGRSPHDGKARR